MAVPSELSLEAIRDFMLENDGKVTNHDLVKHFKRFLTDPETRVEARNQFKEYVNTVATIRNEDGEKYLMLKKKYRSTSQPSQLTPGTPSESMSSLSPTSLFPSSAFVESPDASPSRQPPPYRSPPPVSSPSCSTPTNDTSSSQDSFSEDKPADVSKSSEPEEEIVLHSPPPVPPRRKSSDKLRLENKENDPDAMKRPQTIGAEVNNDVDSEGAEEDDDDQKVSVKERMQKFNRLASESDLARAQAPGYKKSEVNTTKIDDGDSDSVSILDPKTREWLVRSSQANYQELAKLALHNPRLAKHKDLTTTALHWAAKHGNSDVVKLIAGTYEADVNMRTGYTPLHLAMQFGHEDVYNLLVKVYGADPNIRDWSGKKPRQYQASQDTAVSADTFRKIKARKKHAEKDLGFLRIGSLNVRVKRTTEAFSNFLGVGHSSNEKLHKSWGSADNIQQLDRYIMPPPKFAPIKKRKSKKAQDFATSHSTPSTPPRELRTNSLQPTPPADSDSDTACGFGSNWQSTV